MPSLFPSSGILRYTRTDASFKLVVEIDKEITRYYRSLIPKHIKSSSQMYAPHISLVRKETPKNIPAWGKYDGDEIEFVYENIVYFGEVYCWLNVFSKRFESIRTELGLTVDSLYTLPPEGYVKCFHTTLGNFK